MKAAATSTTTSTEAMWRERVREWKASGASATEFVRGRDYAASTLRYWASRLTGPEPRFVRLTAEGTAAAATRPDLVVEVGGARVRVAPGFDPALLAQVVGALGGGGGGGAR